MSRAGHTRCPGTRPGASLQQVGTEIAVPPELQNAIRKEAPMGERMEAPKGIRKGLELPAGLTPPNRHPAPSSRVTDRVMELHASGRRDTAEVTGIQAQPDRIRD